MRRHRHNQLGNKEEIQKILLFFLIGFFIGAVLYYIFQNSFVSLKKQLEDNLVLWSQDGESSLSLFGKSLWQHGKYLLLLGVFAIGPLAKVYQKAFTWYTGLRNGFLLMFFLYAKGAVGMLFYIISFIPHGLLLVPLYLYLFSVTNENRQDKHKVSRWICVILIFITACGLEVKVNLPLMETFL